MEKYVKLQDDLVHMSCRVSNTKTSVLLVDAARAIGELLKEHKEGEWWPYTEYYADDYSECNTRKVFTCSRCGRLEKYKEPYCNCGAKMKVGD